MPPTATSRAAVGVKAAAGSHDSDAPAAQLDSPAAATATEEGSREGNGMMPDEAARAASKKRAGKAAPVLPWMRVPVAIEASEGTPLDEVQGLDPRLRTALEGTGIEGLFPVQTVVWRETAGGASSAHDVCICAPTGSGKTLAYALPVLQALAGRRLPLLRALAVLPTRDLAAQVFGVLRALCPALGLTACLAAGKAGLAAEAELLAAGGVDIVVATPGRLIAHLEGTPGFSLSHLRFLIVDETDRLLRQAYQGWLPKVMAALQGSGSCGGGADTPAETPAAVLAAAAVLPLEQQQGRALGHRVVKLVVSATLTHDPSKIDRLGLYCPRYIAMSAVDHRYQLPRSLQELKLVVPAERKPAALAALLQELQGEQTIIFTSSVESTHRLCLLLAALPCLSGAAVEFSSLVAPAERAAHLEAFRSGRAQVLVCSDAMTRGMDVEGVHNVVNYDAPVYVKTYVHRAGRTARAGRSGRVFTLLRHEDVRHFKDMLRKADNTFVKDHRLDKGALEAVRDDVDTALERMAAVLQSESEAVRPGQLAAAATAAPAAGADVGAGAAKAGAAAAGQGQERQQQAERGTASKRRKVTGVPEFSLLV
ncbi:hypothetical protein D9Q98_004914 [Chlorella vulgaris]|uniref:DEAD-box ATP-dependent RNA helicase 1 n=1 Tax=Chlorella vulgaris TaxID=3077 RepID=A0A9D4YWQ8_CHLVU|nr:hypothetical protein D9Q98_004914 [Chlorella vulgaris]